MLGYFLLIVAATSFSSIDGFEENTVTPTLKPLYQKDLEDCCVAANVDSKCMRLCTTNVDTIFADEGIAPCLPYIQNLIYCISGGKDHTNCCQGRGVQVSCLGLCDGQKNHSIANMHTYTSCIAANLPIAYMCFINALQSQTTIKNEPISEALLPSSPPRRTCASTWCFDPCKYGVKKTPDGCDTCECQNPCEGRICSLGVVCTPVLNNVSKLYEGKCEVGPQKSSCNPTNCRSSCYYGFAKDENGCESCKCIDPCKNVVCSGDTGCTIKLFNATAYEISCTNCILNNCSLVCEYGLKSGTDGCEICECNYPCENVSCSFSEVCVMEKNMNGVYSAVCKALNPICHPIVCDTKCEIGFVKDANGCDTCMCINPCETIKCSSGYECKPMLDLVTMKYKGECSFVQCGKSTCEKVCNYGRQKDRHGCDTCACIDPCMNIICLPGLTCIPIISNITMEYIGHCEANKDASVECSEIMCLMECTYGRLKDSNGCELCQCFDPCQNALCIPGTTCQLIASNITGNVEARCIASEEKCNPVQCMMYCKYGFDKLDGCEICQCKDPCKDVPCLPGYICRPVKLLITNEFNPSCQKEAQYTTLYETPEPLTEELLESTSFSNSGDTMSGTKKKKVPTATLR